VFLRQLSFVAIVFILASTIPAFVSAQELFEEYQETLRGEVLEVLGEEERQIPGTDTLHLVQYIRVEILDGERAGEIIEIENDYLELEEGDKFYLNYFVDISGAERYGVINIDRRAGLMFLALAFVLAVVIFGGWQGARAILALLGSFLAIFYILLPGLLAGWNPLVASFVVAGGILFFAIFFTHGFNRESAVAYGGTMLAVLLTGLFAIVAVELTSLSGFSADESIYLNFNTGGVLNFTALLLGAIIIGVLGVLDDISITQAAVVTEIYKANPNLSKAEVYKRALRVGREHVGALVNTLVLAYTGVALPLLLYLYLSPASLSAVLNMEIVATEIVRIIVGSIGLILTVPIVTGLAVFFTKISK
jgi:uncharacterized membrane protein